MKNKTNSGVIPGAEGRTNFGAGGVRAGVISTSNVPKVDPKAKPTASNMPQLAPVTQPAVGVQPTTGVAQAVPKVQATQSAQGGQPVAGAAQVQPSQSPQPPRPQLVVPTTTVTSNTAKERAKEARKNRPPMDPAKKKKLIMKISLIAGAVVLGVIGIVVLVLTLRVDYGETYRAAKELKAEISEYTSGNNCQYVVNNVSATYVDEQRYAEYVEGCIVVTDGIDEGTRKLEATPGVRKNKRIREQFERYKEAMEAVIIDKGELEKELALYKAWHKYEVAIDGKTADVVTEEEIRAAAEILISSGNETLKAYGEGWQEKTVAYARATQEYYAAGYDDPNKGALRSEMEKARTEQKAWTMENKPEMAEVAPMNFEGEATMVEEFTRLYSMITKAYQENYKKGSGDCTEFLGEVICS